MMNTKLKATITSFQGNSISRERQEIIKPLIDYIQHKVNNNQYIRLNFICTHNSRRSHLSQIWAQAMAYHFGVKNITCYSGGTEATAVFPVVIDTLINHGFESHQLAQSDNPIYSIKYAINEPAIIGFSKTYDDTFNPEFEFAAILTCSQADVGCPFIAGAEQRIPITYEDPKAFDSSPLQKEKYLERSLQIASELFYVFSQIRTND